MAQNRKSVQNPLKPYLQSSQNKSTKPSYYDHHTSDILNTDIIQHNLFFNTNSNTNTNTNTNTNADKYNKKYITSQPQLNELYNQLTITKNILSQLQKTHNTYRKQIQDKLIKIQKVQQKTIQQKNSQYLQKLQNINMRVMSNNYNDVLYLQQQQQVQKKYRQQIMHIQDMYVSHLQIYSQVQIFISKVQDKIRARQTQIQRKQISKNIHNKHNKNKQQNNSNNHNNEYDFLLWQLPQSQFLHKQTLAEIQISQKNLNTILQQIQNKLQLQLKKMEESSKYSIEQLKCIIDSRIQNIKVNINSQ